MLDNIRVVGEVACIGEAASLAERFDRECADMRRRAHPGT